MCRYYSDIYIATHVSIGVGDGRQALPKNIREKYFSGNYFVKFGHFFRAKNHVKFGNFVIFSGKYHKLGHFFIFFHFSYIFFGQKCLAPLKLTELLRLCTFQNVGSITIEMSVLLLLSLCVVTVIKLTSSQSTYDVIQQDSDDSGCRHNEQVLHQLQKDVAELKAAIKHEYVKGTF